VKELGHYQDLAGHVAALPGPRDRDGITRSSLAGITAAPSRHYPAAATSGNHPSLDSYDQPPRISEPLPEPLPSATEAEIRACLPEDTPEDELARVSSEEVEELDRLRDQRQDARDKLRKLTAALADDTARRLVEAACVRELDEERGTVLVGTTAGALRARADKLRRQGERVRNCGEHVEAKVHGCGYMRPPRADAPRWFCGLGRLCAECQRIEARAAREVARFILETGVRHELRFWTLTMPNVSRLELLTVGPRNGLRQVNALSAASDCFRQFREVFEDDHAIRTCFTCKGMVSTKRTRKLVRELERAGVELPRTCYDSKKKARVPWSPLCSCETPAARSCRIAAALRSIELTWNWKLLEQGDGARPFHVHMHVLVDAPWIEQAVLAAVWSWITLKRWPGGAANMKGVDVRMPYVKTENGPVLLRNVRDPELLARGLVEVLKYPTKIADFLSCPDAEARSRAFSEWTVSSARRKLRQATGAWQHWQERLDEIDAAAEDGPRDSDDEETACPTCGEDGGRWYVIGVPRPVARPKATRSCEEFERAVVPEEQPA
jgi:hypothetical protein